jgi:hypothetical protein
VAREATFVFEAEQGVHEPAVTYVHFRRLHPALAGVDVERRAIDQEKFGA